MKNEYLPRIVDLEINESMEVMGAILIEGCKWCGKSTTAIHHAKTIVEFQNPDKKEEYDNIRDTKPSLFLKGEKPLLFDEWQMYPVVWDSIRTDVDHTRLKGQYILTGSAKPKEGETMHTGTGRFARILMRPMSLYESKESTGEVSFEDILKGKDIEGVSKLTLEDIASIIVRGGWPASLDIKSDAKYKIAKQYVSSLIHEEVKNVFNEEISRPTLTDYINTLEKLFVIENIKATNLNFRSKYAIRTKAKKEFVDPSIATAILEISPSDLIKDLNTFGFLFEALCIRDLLIYTQSYGGDITFYRDETNFEIDAIFRTSSGKWGAIEIKLGAGYIDEAAKNLLKFKEKVDTNKVGEPAFLMVLTGSTYSYRRNDGVYVVSIGTLKN